LEAAAKTFRADGILPRAESLGFAIRQIPLGAMRRAPVFEAPETALSIESPLTCCAVHE